MTISESRRLDIPNLCQDCDQIPQDDNHLSKCPRNPINLTAEDLWSPRLAPSSSYSQRKHRDTPLKIVHKIENVQTLETHSWTEGGLKDWSWNDWIENGMYPPVQTSFFNFSDQEREDKHQFFAKACRKEFVCLLLLFSMKLALAVLCTGNNHFWIVILNRTEWGLNKLTLGVNDLLVDKTDWTSLDPFLEVLHWEN